jgi:hypothetical protein
MLYKSDPLEMGQAYALKSKILLLELKLHPCAWDKRFNNCSPSKRMDVVTPRGSVAAEKANGHLVTQKLAAGCWKGSDNARSAAFEEGLNALEKKVNE